MKHCISVGNFKKKKCSFVLYEETFRKIGKEFLFLINISVKYIFADSSTHANLLLLCFFVRGKCKTIQRF